MPSNKSNNKVSPSMHGWRKSAGGSGVPPVIPSTGWSAPQPVRATVAAAKQKSKIKGGQKAKGGQKLTSGPKKSKPSPKKVPPKSAAKPDDSDDTESDQESVDEIPAESKGKKGQQTQKKALPKKAPPKSVAKSDDSDDTASDQESVVAVPAKREREDDGPAPAGEVPWYRAKKLKDLVSSFFIRERATCRTIDGSFTVGLPDIAAMFRGYGPSMIQASPMSWTLNYARLLRQCPHLDKIFKKVAHEVKSCQIGFALDIEIGTPEAEVFGIVVAQYWFGQYAVADVVNEAEENLKFTTLAGNLICSKEDIVRYNTLKLTHRLSVLNYAAGLDLFLPQTEKEWMLHCAGTRLAPASPGPLPVQAAQIVQASVVANVEPPVFLHPQHGPTGVGRGGGGGRGGATRGGGPRGGGGHGAMAGSNPAAPAVPGWKAKLKFPDKQCTYCQGYGHEQSSCSSSAEATYTCWRCHGVGHQKTACPSALK